MGNPGGEKGGRKGAGGAMLEASCVLPGPSHHCQSLDPSAWPKLYPSPPTQESTVPCDWVCYGRCFESALTYLENIDHFLFYQ